MKIGKVPNGLLNELVLKKLTGRNDNVLLSAGVGEDFGVLDLGGECCVVSGDPVTGATKRAGKTAVYVACNDIATCGVRPAAILTTILLPPKTTEAELGALADEIAATADSAGVSVIGGHTEVTDAVNRIVISVTAIGAARRGGYVTTGGAAAGDSLIMTKSAGIEGAAIIAFERESEVLAHFGKAFTDAAQRLSDDMSVVEEGVAAGAFGVGAMHDATEGGVYGAAWEMAEASGKGVTIYKERIPVSGITQKLCAYFKLDAYRLISSGCMLIATNRPEELSALLKSLGICASEIAIFHENPSERFISDGGVLSELVQPGPDELYKIL